MQDAVAHHDRCASSTDARQERAERCDEHDISTIVVGYLPTPEGTAAFEYAKEWAEASGATLVLVNTGRHGDYSHPNFATQQDLDAISAELDDVGVEHEVLQPTDGRPTAEVILRDGRRALGGRDHHRPAATFAGRQADHRQHGPADPARRRLPGADREGCRPVS